MRPDWEYIVWGLLMLITGVLIGIGIAITYGNAWPDWT